MTDTVYAELNIGGPLKTIKQAQDLIDLLAKEKWTKPVDSTNIFSEYDLKEYILEIIQKEQRLYLAHDNAENGEFPDIDRFVAQDNSLCCSTFYQAGETFPSGFNTYLLDGSHHACDAYDGDAFIPISWLEAELSDCKTNNEKQQKVDDILHSCHIQSGQTLPPLEALTDIIEWLQQEINNYKPHLYNIYRVIREEEHYSVEARSPYEALEKLESGEAIYKGGDTVGILDMTIIDQTTGKNVTPNNP
ncbi:hypothetical protein [Bartonella sp. LJL80]